MTDLTGATMRAASLADTAMNMAGEPKEALQNLLDAAAVINPGVADVAATLVATLERNRENV